MTSDAGSLDPVLFDAGSRPPGPSVPAIRRKQKVAIVHYWLVGMRGGEKVLEALCELYPDADLFTHVYKQGSVSPTIERHSIRRSFVSALPFSDRFYKLYMPLMPMALEHLDLRAYDLVISSESGPAKGVVTSPDATHVCYCHSPMRYAWNMYHDYRAGGWRLKRIAMTALLHYVRNWDTTSAQRVDAIAANSRTTARRIRAYWRREAEIVYPPVDVDAFAPVGEAEIEPFYLMVGELVAYKRADLAIRALGRRNIPLVVIGGGEMLAQLKREALPSVKIMGPQSLETLVWHYARCRALIFPGEEDFGIVPVEAMASGRPVVAYARGGACETVVDGRTGVFFHKQTEEALLEAIDRLATLNLLPQDAVAQARRFRRESFKASMSAFVEKALCAGRERV